MNAEIEAKFLNIDHDEIRHALIAAGGNLEHPMRDMRRALIEEPHHAADNSFLRIRDEGDKTTLTFKRKLHGEGEATIDSTLELETTLAIFREAGWSPVTYQESRRETWQLDDVEVVLDEWPWITPYIEIEGSSEAAVKSAAIRLGLSWDDAVFGSVDVIYHQSFPDMTVRGVIDIASVRFADSSPECFGERAV